MNRAGCFAKTIVHGERIGLELLTLAKRAREEGKISEEVWRKLPSSPDGLVKILLGQNSETNLNEALLDTYSETGSNTKSQGIVF